MLSKFCVLQNFDKLISCFAKLEENFAKQEIKKFRENFAKLQKRKFLSNPTPTQSVFATHPSLPTAKRFFNAARQCYFDMKTNKEPCFSILSIIIL